MRPRGALWTAKTITDPLPLIPSPNPPAATDPIRAMLSFRDNKTTLLLCTPAAARGLDLPAVSFVYSVGCPADAAQYLHRAGRAGRIGSTRGAG